MYKVGLLIDQMLDELSQTPGNNLPKILWKSPKNGRGENYFSTLDKGSVSIDAESPLAAAYAISQIKIAASCKHLGEYLGQGGPRFHLRPLWVGCGPDIISPSGLGAALPRFFLSNGQGLQQVEQKCNFFCRRVIELGYNAVVLGNHSDSQPVFNSDIFNEIESFCRLIHDHGLKTIIKPRLFLKDSLIKTSRCPFDPEYQSLVRNGLKALSNAVPSLDFIFWESSLLHPDFAKHSAARDFTLPELVLAEVHMLEENLPENKALIYYIPSPDPVVARQHSLWMPSLCDDVGPGTIISFSAVAGNCSHDHMPPHPFWDQLRVSPDISSTCLLPIINTGSISQGEGLWPAPTMDLFEKYYSRLHRHRFAGVIALTNYLPKSGSMLDCSLWTASQLLWHSQSPHQIMETWFLAQRPEWDFTANMDTLRSTRQLIVDLSFLRALTRENKRGNQSSEECRLMTESVLARLKDLQMRSEKLERKRIKKAQHPSLSDYMQVFVRDAQRIVLHFLQCFNLSFPYAMGGEELQESFWMQMSSGGGQGIRPAVNVPFLDEPRRGAAGSSMEAIFMENRLI